LVEAVLRMSLRHLVADMHLEREIHRVGPNFGPTLIL
jgi:hypothetical protein